MHPRRVAIIGAGVSGLASAVSLFEHSEPGSLEVTMYESRREAGGRTRSFTDLTTGDTLDNGQHLMMGCYTSTLRYLEAIGTKHLLLFQNSLRLAFALPTEQRISEVKLPENIPVPLNMLLGLLSSNLLHSYEKVAAARFGIGMMLFRYDKKTMNGSCADLFRLAHQPASLIEKLWEPIVVGTMNLSITKASAQVFLHTMRLIFLQNKRYSSLLFPRIGLSDILVRPAVSYLDRQKCTIRFGEHISEVRAGNGLVYVESGNGNDVYDALVFAGNYHDVAFLPAEIRNSIPSITYSPIANAYLWLDKKVVDRPICGYIGTSLHWTFSKPTHFAEELVACTMSAADALMDMDSEEIATLFWDEITRAFPNHGARLVRSVIIKERRATPVLDASLQVRRPHAETVIPNIFLAGDLVQNGLPMTIEGAIRNGEKAAKLALGESR